MGAHHEHFHVYNNHTSTKLSLYSNETSQDKLSEA